MGNIKSRIQNDLDRIEHRIRTFPLRPTFMTDREAARRFPEYKGERTFELDGNDRRVFMRFAGGGCIRELFCNGKGFEAKIVVEFSRPGSIGSITIGPSLAGHSESMVIRRNGACCIEFNSSKDRDPQMDQVSWRRIVRWLRHYVESDLRSRQYF